jgi:quinol monooxygenase YgiN
MRKMMTVLAGLSLFAGGWSQAPAQQAADDGPMYREIVRFEVAPAHAAAFEMTMEKIAGAAKLANLSADYGWMFFRDGSNFTLVYPVKSMAYFDDPEQWMRQFTGTPGEAALMEAFGEFSKLDYSAHTQVLKVLPEHSYQPATPIDNPNYVMVYMNWVRPGHQEAHAQNTAALMELISEAGWRYAVHAYETVIGDGGLRIYAVPFDNLATFHGEGSLRTSLTQKELTEKWDTLQGERMKLVRAMDSRDEAYVPGMSYMPMAEDMSGGD